MLRKTALVWGLALLVCSPAIPTTDPGTTPCNARLQSVWKKRLVWLAGGLVLAVPSYSAVEYASTDPVDHFYPCPQCKADEKSVHIALIGDSLSTRFTFSQDIFSTEFPTLFKLRTTRSGGWFTDHKKGPPDSFAERCKGKFSLRADCHAQAGASIFGSPDASFGKRLGQIAHLTRQIDEVLKRPLPDHLWIWMGHNDADYVYTCSKHPELDPAQYCKQLPREMRSALEPQLKRVIEKAIQENRELKITLFGLMDFEKAIEVREEILKAKKENPALYPYLAQAIEGFPTLMPTVSWIPDHRALAAQLSLDVNAEWEKLASDLHAEFSGDGVYTVYSSALTDVPLRVSSLAVDEGLHFSPQGASDHAAAAAEYFFNIKKP